MDAYKAVVRGIDHNERDRTISTHFSIEGAREALPPYMGKEVPQWVRGNVVEAFLYGYIEKTEILP